MFSQQQRDPVEIGRHYFENLNPNPAVFKNSYKEVFDYEPELGERVRVMVYNPHERRQHAWWIHGFLWTHDKTRHYPLIVLSLNDGWVSVKNPRMFYEMYKDGVVVRDE